MIYVLLFVFFEYQNTIISTPALPPEGIDSFCPLCMRDLRPACPGGNGTSFRR